MKYRVAMGLCLASLGLAQTAFAKTDLSFNIFFPQTHFVWPVFQEWADDVADATAGEVRITFPAQSVAPPPGILDAVRNGVADAGFIFNGFIAETAPGTMLTQMPWTSMGDSAAVSTALWDSYEQNFAPVETLPGVHLLSMFHLGPTYLCSTTSTPISTLADLKSRRVWALPGTISETMKAMDLSIIAGPAVQLQELTSRNTVDAHLGVTAETIITMGAAPYTKSCIDMSPALLSASFSIFINQRSWDRLTPEHRQAISDLSGAALARKLGDATNRADADARTELENMGVTFAPAEAELVNAMVAASEPVTAEWVDAVDRKYGVDGAAILKETQDAVAAASAQ